jgi:tRNA(Arg) A34 adenosine deaminase TadA
MQLDDEKLMRAALEVAWRSRNRGDNPFGAILVDESGNILMEAGNTVVTEQDATGHAETNLMRNASIKYDRDFLAKCTMYTTAEPCPMCSGAVYWTNVRRVVYGLSEEVLYEIFGWDNEEVLYVPCREILERGQKPVEVVGPVLEDEAREVHLGYWEQSRG